jgi:peptidoglycan/LPS O-acetylase OafA/YrhL
MKYRPELDGMRAIAVVSVMFVHSDLIGRGADLRGAGTSLPHLLSGGVFGVDIFFVLSGFLITSLLLQEHERTGRIDFLAFYMRRALRLLPAMALLLLGCTALVLSGHAGNRFDLTAVALAAAYISNFVVIIAGDRLGILTQTWSLSIEEQFYTLWPITLLLFLRLTSRRTIMAAMLGAAAVAVLLRLIFFLVWSGQTDDKTLMIGTYTLPTRADGLLFGAAVAAAYCWGFLPKGRVASLLTIVSAGWVCWMLVFVNSIPNPNLYYGTYALVAIATAGLIAGLTTAPPGWVKSAMSWSPLVWTGKISYGLYLYHVPVFALLAWPLEYPALAFAVAFGLTFAAAALSYYAVERRFLAMKHRIRVRVDGTIPSTTPTLST